MGNLAGSQCHTHTHKWATDSWVDLMRPNQSAIDFPHIHTYTYIYIYIYNSLGFDRFLETRVGGEGYEGFVEPFWKMSTQDSTPLADYFGCLHSGGNAPLLVHQVGQTRGPHYSQTSSKHGEKGHRSLELTPQGTQRITEVWVLDDAYMCHDQASLRSWSSISVRAVARSPCHVFASTVWLTGNVVSRLLSAPLLKV